MEYRRSLVVNSTPLETRIALLENGQICEIFIERTTHASQVGDIYKGKAAKLLPGMQSAFINIGGPKDGFLYLDEPETSRIGAEEGLELEEEPEHTAVLDFPPAPPPLPPVKEGDEILVQVVKDPIGSKGPRLSRHLSFPGRFLVFMPGIDHVGISRKITDPAERERLRELIRAHAQPGEGFIVRTAAIGEKDEDLVQDVSSLREIWRETQARVAGLRAPSLAWQDARLLQKVLRDLFREEVTSFWIDREEAYREVVAFAEKLHPEWVERVKLWTSDLPIFEAFGLEQEIEAARQPKVYLKRGGSIVINQTEALVSVDVNTGKFVGKKDLEETVFLTNIEAIPEIVRQLRLRNLGGIVIIDFIDMVDEPHRAAVLARLQDELRRDRNHARAESISELGLVEMTRKRTGPSLDRQLTDPCGTCGGSGRVPSPETILLRAYREMVRQGDRLKGCTVRLSVHPELRALLPADAREGLLALARTYGAHVLWVERSDGPRNLLGLELLPPKSGA
jgi:ribonuclease G